MAARVSLCAALRNCVRRRRHSNALDSRASIDHPARGRDIQANLENKTLAALAASWPKTLDSLYGGCEYFCKRIAEVTDNRFQIQPFAAGEIVPGLQVLDAVSNGTVEMGNTALYYYWGKNPAFTFGTALPFGLNTRQQISWLLTGDGQSLLNDLLKEYNCLGIPTGNTGAQMGGWFRKEIKSTADLQGLKFRVGGFAGTIIAKGHREV